MFIDTPAGAALVGTNVRVLGWAYTVVAFARSTTTNSFSIVRLVRVTVQ